MLRQLKLLTGVQLCNLFGLNEFRFTKDKKKKRRYLGMGIVVLYLLAMLVIYVTTLCSGLFTLGLGAVVPEYLFTICSILILFFSFFKAGSVIFQKKNYEALIAMPVSQASIVLSRYFSMYVTNLIASVLVLLTGMITYSFYAPTTLSFWIFGIIGILFVPMLPMTIATAIGAAITAISSRMKHKSLISAGLSILVVVAVMASSYLFADNPDIFTSNMVQMLTETIRRVYPPAEWFGRGMMQGEPGMLLLFIAVSTALLALTVFIVQHWFQPISSALNATTAKNNFSTKQLEEATGRKQSSVLFAMIKRELKRYFASSIYVTNTLVGYLLMIMAGIALLVAKDSFLEQVGVYKDLILNLAPYILGLLAAMVPITASSISMEGKQWWLAKTLPVRNKDIFDSKILTNLLLAVPGYLISVICCMISLRLDVWRNVWLVLIPAVYILFSSVSGLTINLAIPIFDWENEVRVVKQSAAVGISMVLSMVISIVPGVILFTQPVDKANLINALIVFVLLIATIILYIGNNKKDLRKIG